MLVAAIALSVAAPAAAQRGGRGRFQGAGGERGSSGRGMMDNKFEAAAPDIGESLPAITVYDEAGNPVTLDSLLEGHYSVVVLGCLT